VEKSTKNILWGLGITAGIFGIVVVAKRKQILSFILSKEQEYFIKDLHPKAQDIFRKFIKLIEAKGYNVIINSGYRTFSEQSKLKKENSKNATPGSSMHNYGFAIDINLQKGTGLWKKEDSDEHWLKTGVPQLAKELGLRWGGDYKGYQDAVHFDIAMDAGKLLTLAYKQFGTNPENIRGNEVQLT